MNKLVTSAVNIFTYYEFTRATQVFSGLIKLLIQNRFIRSQASGVTSLFGLKVQYGNRGSLYGMFTEIFVEQNYLIPPTKEPIEIIDCGSNIGMSVLYFKFLAPNSLITAFEPNPYTFEVLKNNIESNHFSVTLNNAGLSGVAGEMAIYTDDEDISSQSASTTKHLSNKQRPLKSVQAKMVTLSSYITKPIDVLKLDIEGAEGEVLDELAQAGKLQLVKRLFIEYHFDGVNTTYPLGRMLTTLDSAGYKYVIETGISFPYVINQSTKNYSSKITAWRE